jgi:2-methylcitrate dehydratase PrpD
VSSASGLLHAGSIEGAPADVGTVSERLAAFALDLSLTDLPPPVLDKVKLFLLDIVGVCVGSAGLAAGKAMLDQCERWGGAGPCTLIGRGSRVPAQYAAFGNGALGHGQDFDDTHTETIMHPSCVLVPAVLAAAERHDRSGREAIAMLAGATEVVLRLAAPASGAINRRGIQASSSLGAFGSALVSARAGGFDHARTVQAIGIAGSFASGLMECVPAATTAKQFQPGWGGFCGVMAADLAAAGFSGPRTVFEGGLGYFAAFLHGATLDLGRIFAGLGETWLLRDVRPKLYPCAHNVHASIECAEALRGGESFRPDQIAAVLCESPGAAAPMVCEPWDKKIAPVTGYDARFSLPYVVAVMLVKGHAGTQAFTDEFARDPHIRAVMARTRYQPDPDFQFKNMPGRVTVTLTDGRKLTHEIRVLRGDAANPLGTAELLEKFDANTEAFGRQRSQQIAELILGIETLPRIRDLLELLRPDDAYVAASL